MDKRYLHTWLFTRCAAQHVVVYWCCAQAISTYGDAASVAPRELPPGLPFGFARLLGHSISHTLTFRSFKDGDKATAADMDTGDSTGFNLLSELEQLVLLHPSASLPSSDPIFPVVCLLKAIFGLNEYATGHEVGTLFRLSTDCCF